MPNGRVTPVFTPTPAPRRTTPLTVDRLLAQIRRRREQATGVRERADVSDVLTRLSIGGLGEDRLPLAPPPLLDPTGVGGRGFAPLTFAQTEAGQRLAASLALETERISGTERLKLEETIHSLALELLPPADVETAMAQVRRGELVKSKLAFQAVLQNLSDETEHAERRADLALQEENERRTLREARARITVDMVGRDLGRAVLFALGAGE